MGIAAANRGEADAKGAGIAGLVLGYLSVIVLIGYIVFFVVMIFARPGGILGRRT